jgi:holin-like protein
MKLPLQLRRLCGIFLILLFYLLGTALSAWTGHVVPGSVIGMLLLFFSLLFRIIRPESVEPAARSLTSTMSLFFIPAGVGVMAYWNVLDENKFTIIAACTISTVLVIATVGWIQELFEKRSAHD